jgi:hypothetical protein
MRPQAAPFASDACSLARLTDILTGESAHDDIGNNSVCFEPFSGEFSHVMIAGHSRPMLSQHAPAERIDLAERDGLEPARALKT